MKERPILFSGPMVRAILEGKKTQTRRVVKPQPPCGYALTGYKSDLGYPASQGHIWAGFQIPGSTGSPSPVCFKCPYGQPGDRLWVRETWTASGNEDGHPINAKGELVALEDAEIFYRADTRPGPYGCDLLPDGSQYFDSWRTSIHMPRWACRILLEVVDVRVERLQGISREDIRAEGIGLPPSPHFPHKENRSELHSGFAYLWDSLAAHGSRWEDNPWVWAVTFKRVGASS